MLEKLDLKTMSIEDLLDEYFYAREEQEAIWRRDDYADLSPENEARVNDTLYRCVQELKHRCGEED